MNLGRWHRNCIKCYADGTLSDERIKQLEQIGMNWNSVNQRTWLAYYDEAKRYYAENGDLNVNLHYRTVSGLNLGILISGQRYNANDAAWNSFYENLKEYRRFFGNCDVSNRYVTDTSAKLGSWCANQRTKYKNGKLTENQIAKLTAVGFKWNLKQNVVI